MKDLNFDYNLPEKSGVTKGLISVVVPIYGSFNVERLILTVESARNQKGTDVEVVVSESGESPKLKGRLPEDVKYIFTKHIPQKNLSDFNPGAVRNMAIKHSTGEFIYTVDADIIFYDNEYLKKIKDLLIQNQTLILYKPKMKRLPLDDFVNFFEKNNEIGIEKTIKSLDLTQDFIVTVDGKKRKMVVVMIDTDEYKKILTTTVDEFYEYAAKKFPIGEEPRMWAEDRHCGSTFFRRSQFDEVGGYCEEFINWGAEDYDLQWKFKEMYGLQFIPEDLFVIHLDHERGYISTERFAQNMKIYDSREKKGIAEAIKADLKKWNNAQLVDFKN